MHEKVNTVIERDTWGLVYSSGFKEIHEKHPNIISTIEGLLLASSDEIKKVHTEDEKISLELLYTKLHKKYYALNISDEMYFLKEIELAGNESKEGGVHEYTDAQEAARLLDHIEGVETVQYVFGFTNNAKRYIATKWNTSVEKPLVRVLQDIESDNTGDLSLRKESILSRVEKIKKVLKDFKDVTTANMGYNAHTDTIFVFDINKETGSPLGESPDDEL
jgi:hypothetical protein